MGEKEIGYTLFMRLHETRTLTPGTSELNGTGVDSPQESPKAMHCEVGDMSMVQATPLVFNWCKAMVEGVTRPWRLVKLNSPSCESTRTVGLEQGTHRTSIGWSMVTVAGGRGRRVRRSNTFSWQSTHSCPYLEESHPWVTTSHIH